MQLTFLINCLRGNSLAYLRWIIRLWWLRIFRQMQAIITIGKIQYIDFTDFVFMRDLQNRIGIGNTPAVSGIPNIFISITHPPHPGHIPSVQINAIMETSGSVYIACAIIIYGINQHGIAVFFRAQIFASKEIAVFSFSATHIIASWSTGNNVITELPIYPVITCTTVNNVVVTPFFIYLYRIIAV